MVKNEVLDPALCGEGEGGGVGLSHTWSLVFI